MFFKCSLFLYRNFFECPIFTDLYRHLTEIAEVHYTPVTLNSHQTTSCSGGAVRCTQMKMDVIWETHLTEVTKRLGCDWTPRVAHLINEF